MNIGYFASRSYSSLCENLFREFNPFQADRCLAFLGVGHGIAEVCESLAATYEHKRAIALIEGVSPYFEEMAIHFSRKGYKVQKTKATSGEDLKKWVEELDRGTLFLLSAHDHPLSGEIYLDQDINSSVEEKKIFHLQVSFNLHKYSTVPVSPYQVTILSAKANRAVALLGGRVKFQTLTCQFLDWSEFDANHFKPVLQNAMQSRQEIEKAESETIQGMQVYFGKVHKRIFDRMVVYWNDIDSSAIRSLLLEKLGLEDSAPGYDSKIECFSPCRWKDIKAKAYALQKDGSAIERGLLTIDHSLLGDNFSHALDSCVREIYTLQQG